MIKHLTHQENTSKELIARGSCGLFSHVNTPSNGCDHAHPFTTSTQQITKRNDIQFGIQSLELHTQFICSILWHGADIQKSHQYITCKKTL